MCTHESIWFEMVTVASKGHQDKTKYIELNEGMNSASFETNSAHTFTVTLLIYFGVGL